MSYELFKSQWSLSIAMVHDGRSFEYVVYILNSAYSGVSSSTYVFGYFFHANPAPI